jgi:hypothetical protein
MAQRNTLQFLIHFSTVCFSITIQNPHLLFSFLVPQPNERVTFLKFIVQENRNLLLIIKDDIRFQTWRIKLTFFDILFESY